MLHFLNEIGVFVLNLICVAIGSKLVATHTRCCTKSVCEMKLATPVDAHKFFKKLNVLTR